VYENGKTYRSQVWTVAENNRILRWKKKLKYYRRIVKVVQVQGIICYEINNGSISKE
jgi:hypothetical protein